jgi:hypothetical protein
MTPNAETRAAIEKARLDERGALDVLRAKVDAGRTSGPYKNAEAVFARLLAKYQAQADGKMRC